MKTKLAVMKEEGRLLGGGYHYMLFPAEIKDDFQAKIYKHMGHIIIEVEPEQAKELLEGARLAMKHQIEIAVIADQWEALGRKK